MLQSVIRNLVDSNDEEERLAQRSKLESDLEVANERLDNLVQGSLSTHTCTLFCSPKISYGYITLCIYDKTYIWICAVFPSYLQNIERSCMEH